MTREEEIHKAAIKCYHNSLDKRDDFYYNPMEDYTDGIIGGFIEGAKWADKHPKEANGKELLYVCQKTVERTKNEMIEKTCKWIGQAYTNGVLDWKNCDDIIDNFRKAMEK